MGKAWMRLPLEGGGEELLWGLAVRFSQGKTPLFLLHFLLSYELVLTSLDAVTVITDDYGTSKRIRDI